MRTSEQISSFLDLLRRARSDYDIARSRQSDADKEIQDILHWLEDYEDPPVDGDGARLILGVIGMARRERRAAKDTAAVMQPIAEWAKDHKSTMDSLAQLLGSVRKEEKGQENRYYAERTDIMKVMLGGPDEEAE